MNNNNKKLEHLVNSSCFQTLNLPQNVDLSKIIENKKNITNSLTNFLRWTKKEDDPKIFPKLNYALKDNLSLSLKNNLPIKIPKLDRLERGNKNKSMTDNNRSESLVNLPTFINNSSKFKINYFHTNKIKYNLDDSTSKRMNTNQSIFVTGINETSDTNQILKKSENPLNKINKDDSIKVSGNNLPITQINIQNRIENNNLNLKYKLFNKEKELANNNKYSISKGNVNSQDSENNSESFFKRNKSKIGTYNSKEKHSIIQKQNQILFTRCNKVTNDSMLLEKSITQDSDVLKFFKMNKNKIMSVEDEMNIKINVRESLIFKDKILSRDKFIMSISPDRMIESKNRINQSLILWEERKVQQFKSNNKKKQELINDIIKKSEEKRASLISRINKFVSISKSLHTSVIN